MKYKAIIWDMDGTILDTLSDLHDSVNHMLVSNGYGERTFDETRRSVGNGIRRLVALSVPEGENNPDFERLFGEFREYYSAHSRVKTLPYEGIGETLDALKKLGVKMAVVSNKIDEAVKELAREFYPQMDFALGEKEGVPIKPAPDMVETALSFLGTEKCEAVYIGDSEVDVLTARNSGLDCISVLWGFRTKEELIENGASVFAEKPQDIIDIIGGRG